MIPTASYNYEKDRFPAEASAIAERELPIALAGASEDIHLMASLDLRFSLTSL
ncbi:hypothetical protein [Mesorhizobium sp.]|uniref:hypothetical protein n=1 Tax=Mesorhizobium sp. TaxID=1871066 RepID=UPI0025C44606|nr:hypothetical protein [Mesorhizobium sp.]